jgi:tetratricopeptide (TPR) repeat protein
MYTHDIALSYTFCGTHGDFPILLFASPAPARLRRSLSESNLLAEIERDLSVTMRMLTGSVRRIPVFIAVACLTSMVFLCATQGAEDSPATKEAAQRKAYADTVRETYNFRFGKDKISTPGNAAIEGNDFIRSDAYLSAEYCGHCHQEAYHQWRQALHSNSFRTPFYRQSANILIRTKGIEFARHCDSCHNPIAVLSGAMTTNSTADRMFDRDGLTCLTCHSIMSVKSKVGNGGFVMAVPSALVDEKGNRIPGMVPDAEILAHLDRHSAAVMQDIYHTPEFCAACHKANLPPTLNDYKWIRAFTAYDEWQNSKFSNRNPLTFYTADFTTCQGCHMKREPNALPEPGSKNGTFASHRWLAGNTAVPFYFGFNEQLAKTVDFLRTGNYLNLDIFGLKVGEDGKLIAPLGTVPFTVNAGDMLEAYVVVQNKAIGHSFIPEVRDLYESWVQFTVTGPDGTNIYESGFLKPDGMLEPGAHSFTNRPVNVVGDFVDNHVVSSIHSVAYDNTVQSGRSALVRYQFRLPADVKGPVNLQARINYRHLRRSYLNNIFGPDHPSYPVVEIASRSRTINLGKNGPTQPLPTDNEDWMRWNNLGIGMLDELQYADAIQAFEQVTRLRPEYKDGYINVGLTDIEWEKYDEARQPLEKALALKPNDARALYYMALVERRARNSDAEIADLEKVVTQYPESRDARRELGISYYQQHRSDDAIAQFTALQAIDPDDLAAHYNLAILYRRKGMKHQAELEAGLYAIKRIDPGAPTYSLEYLRKHPEISTESVPWHVHSEFRETQPPAAAGGTP